MGSQLPMLQQKTSFSMIAWPDWLRLKKICWKGVVVQAHEVDRAAAKFEHQRRRKDAEARYGLGAHLVLHLQKQQQRGLCCARLLRPRVEDMCCEWVTCRRL